MSRNPVKVMQFGTKGLVIYLIFNELIRSIYVIKLTFYNQSIYVIKLTFYNQSILHWRVKETM